jgi:hypothetical protein
MRVKMVVGMLVGSVVVAVACSAQHALDNPSDKDGGVLDALLDAVSSETKDAKAEPVPTVTQVTCVDDGKGAWTATLDLPGRSRDDIGRTSALACRDGIEWGCYQAVCLVKDGALRVSCGTPSDHVAYVRFSVPPTP